MRSRLVIMYLGADETAGEQVRQPRGQMQGSNWGQTGVRGHHITLFHDEGRQEALGCTMGSQKGPIRRSLPMALAQVPGSEAALQMPSRQGHLGRLHGFPYVWPRGQSA